MNLALTPLLPQENPCYNYNMVCCKDLFYFASTSIIVLNTYFNIVMLFSLPQVYKVSYVKLPLLCIATTITDILILLLLTIEFSPCRTRHSLQDIPFNSSHIPQVPRKRKCSYCYYWGGYLDAMNRNCFNIS